MIHAHSIENMFFYRCTNVQPAAAKDAEVGAYFNILVRPCMEQVLIIPEIYILKITED